MFKYMLSYPHIIYNQEYMLMYSWYNCWHFGYLLCTYLIHDILDVNRLQYLGLNDSMQVSVHKLKHQVDVLIVTSSDDIQQLYHILVRGKLLMSVWSCESYYNTIVSPWMFTWTHLKEHDLSVRALSISGIGKSIKDLFQCHYLTSSTVNALPHNAIGLYVRMYQDTILLA